MSGLDAIDTDPQAQPPHGEFGEAEEGSATGERHSVIAADRRGQAKLLEGTLKDGKSVLFLGGVQSLTTQQVATGEVGEREGVAVAPIRQHELPLVVGAPQGIGICGAREGCTSGFVAGALAAARGQAVPIEHRVYGADGWKADAQILAPELLPDLGGTPGGMIEPMLDDQRLKLLGKPISLPIRA